jgi:hypothetical protein
MRSTHTTNIEKFTVKFINGLNALLDHYFNFGPDGYRLILRKKRFQKSCDVTIVSTDRSLY